MSAYVVYVRDRILDPEECRKYEESARAASIGHALTPLAFYGAVETLKVLATGAGECCRLLAQ